MNSAAQQTVWEAIAQVGGVVSRNERSTLQLGKDMGLSLAQDACREGGQTGAPVLLLEGEMGAGKTVLVRGIAEGLGLDPGMVQSPTFTLMNEYQDGSGLVRLVHCDLYRLEPEDVESTGLLDLLEAGEAPIVVEWAERLPDVLQIARTVRLSRLSGENNEGLRRIEALL